MTRRMLWNDVLIIELAEDLGIPEPWKSWSLNVTAGKTVKVTCEYLPEAHEDQKEEEPDA